MDTHFNKSLADGYHSSSQKIRILTESWVQDNLFYAAAALNCSIFPIILPSPISTVPNAKTNMN